MEVVAVVVVVRGDGVAFAVLVRFGAR